MKITNKDLETMAYSLPWRLLGLLPNKVEERDILIKSIIETWEEIKDHKKMIKLESCPFCGMEDIKVVVLRGVDYLYYYYKCPKCRACAGLAKTEEEARKLWNTRSK